MKINREQPLHVLFFFLLFLYLSSPPSEMLHLFELDVSLPIEQQVSGDLFQLRERDIGILGWLGVVDQQNLYKALD